MVHKASSPSRTLIQWFADAWRTYSTLGIATSAEDPISRRIILTNRVAAVVFLLGIGVSAYFLQEGYSSITLYWFTFLLGAVWIMPFLNVMGHTWVSRHILSSLMPLFIIAIVAHTRVSTPDEVHEASFYIPRFFLMAICFFPLLLFAPSEKWRMYISFGINVIILLLFNQLLDAFGAGMGLLEPVVQDAFFISASSVISLFIIGSGFFFLNQLNHNYELRISELLSETEEKNKRINYAINYASTIQKVVLPNANVASALSNRTCIVYQPLDVVSGDFYFLEQRDGHILFGVIDCTGHGVPGAFMSMMAYGALQRAFDSIGPKDPRSIVGLMNRHFHDDLSRSGNPNMRDGMDVVLCGYDTDTGQLRISGANLSAFVVQNGKTTVYPCDRGYISMGNPDRTFTETVLQLHTGDTVYISSDGISDQFGGPKNKRIGKRGLANELQAICKLPIEEQANAIKLVVDTWTGTESQTDDICLIGFKA
jgi:serine phosphatase RsbU (regulator of sigma subunit)